jgi:hypothetical protein
MRSARDVAAAAAAAPVAADAKKGSKKGKAAAAADDDNDDVVPRAKASAKAGACAIACAWSRPRACVLAISRAHTESKGSKKAATAAKAPTPGLRVVEIAHTVVSVLNNMRRSESSSQES